MIWNFVVYVIFPIVCAEITYFEVTFELNIALKLFIVEGSLKKGEVNSQLDQLGGI